MREINLKNLKKVRKEKGLRISDMIETLEISPAFYSQLENGKRGMSYKRAIAIAEILNTTPDKLFLTEDK